MSDDRVTVVFPSGARLMLISQIARQASQWLAIVALARFVTPTEFGVANMALVVAGLLLVLRDFGVGAAIIYLRDLSDRQISGVHWWNTLFGLGLAVAIYMLAPSVAAGFSEPRVEALIEAIAVIPALTAISALHQARLERDLAFRRVAIVELSAALTGAVLGIAAGMRGAGEWSLVVLMLAPAIVVAILMPLASRWRPLGTLDTTGLGRVVGYSANLAGYSVANFVARNGDNVLVGRYLGAQSLGIYGISYKIALYPVQVISTIVARMLFPFCARYQSRLESFRQIYLVTVRGLVALSFPIVILIFVLSDEIVLVLLGAEWSTVSEVLRLLAIAALAQVVVAPVGVIYQARGRTDWMFWWGVASGLVTLVAVAIGLRWGVSGVAWAFVISVLMLSMPGLYMPFRLIGLRLVDLFAALWRLLSIALLCGVLADFVLAISVPSASPLSRLIVGVGVYVPVYLALLYTFERKLSRSLWSLVRGRTNELMPKSL